MKDLLSEIESYWTTRAEGYSEVNHKELNGMQKGAWLEVLKGQFPEKAKDEIKILDIGTGPGFFPVILAEAGYKVLLIIHRRCWILRRGMPVIFVSGFLFIRWMLRIWNLRMMCLML